MENDKYFTPNIEDLHIKYQLEVLINDNWEQVTVENITMIGIKFLSLDKKTEWSLINLKEHNILRVSYLTKEQLEAEGWDLIQIYPTGACIFQKGTKEEGCELTYDFQKHKIHFTRLYFYGLDDEYTRTKLTWDTLECKDINTFRKIIKLLKIN